LIAFQKLLLLLREKQLDEAHPELRVTSLGSVAQSGPRRFSVNSGAFS
jgi:hypothetical protein